VGYLRRSPPRDAEKRLAKLETLLNILHAARWNRRQAARDLNVSCSTPRYKMNKMGIR